MQRKLVTLVHCQLVEEEGRIRAMRAARSLGERTVTELILQHQNPQQLSSNLWAAVRARGCQFLGPGIELTSIFTIQVILKVWCRNYKLCTKASSLHILLLSSNTPLDNHGLGISMSVFQIS